MTEDNMPSENDKPQKPNPQLRHSMMFQPPFVPGQEPEKPADPSSDAAEPGNKSGEQPGMFTEGYLTQDTARRNDLPSTDFMPPASGGAKEEELKRKLMEAESLLAKEKEKLLEANIKAKQDEALSAKVEASLKDLQHKMQRDIRERELDQDRAELRGKVKDLEEKLVHERETWMEIMKRNYPAAPAQPAQPASIADKIDFIDKKWRQDREDAEQRMLRMESMIESLSADKFRAPGAGADIAKTVQDKVLLNSELGKIREALSKLEKQGAFLDQIASLVMSLRNTVDKLQNRETPGPLFQPLSQQNAVVPALKDNNEQPEETLKAKDAIAGQADESKLRMVAELLKLKKALIRLKAVNTVLERELNAARTEKMAVLSQAAAQTEEIQGLKQRLSQAQSQHREALEDLNRQWAEKNVSPRDFEDSLKKQQDEYEAKIKELESNFSLQSKSYTAQIEENRVALEAGGVKLQEMESEYNAKLAQLETVKNALEKDFSGQLASLAEEKRRLEEQHGKLAEDFQSNAQLVDQYSHRIADMEGEKAVFEGRLRELAEQKTALEAESGKLSAEKNSLTAEIKNLQLDRAKLAMSIYNLTKQGQDLSQQKAQLAAALAEFKQKEQASSNFIMELRAKVDSLEQANIKLETELSHQQAALKYELGKAEKIEVELKDLLAKETAVSSELKRKVEHYETIAKSFMDRLKWALTGKTN